MDMKRWSRSVVAAAVTLIVGTASADKYQINFWGWYNYTYGDGTRWGQCYYAENKAGIDLTSFDGGVKGAHITWSAPNCYEYARGGNGSNWLWTYLDDGWTDKSAPIKIKITGIPFKAYGVDVCQQADNEGYGFNPPALNGTFYAYDGSKISLTRNDPSLKYGSARNVNYTYDSTTGNRAYPQRAFTGSTLTIESGTAANNARGNIAAIFIWEWGVDGNDSININVIGGNDTQYGDSVTTTGYLGYIPTSAAGWNNFAAMRNKAAINETHANVNEVLKGGTVAASTASVTLRAPRANVVGGKNTHKSNPGKMFWGYLDDGATVEVKCVPYTKYDAYVYCSSDGEGNFGSITVNGEDYSFPAGLGDHVSVRETSDGWAEPVIGRNCIRVTGLTAENLVIATAAKDGSVGTTTGIAGVQIINAGSRKNIVSGEKTASELDGKAVVLGGNLTLTVDQALATGVTIAGTADKTLTIVGGDANDLAKIDRSGFAGTLVWNTETVNAAVTIKNGTVNVGGTLALGDDGSLVFDYSTYPIASVAAAQTLTLTGATSDYGDRVSFVPPTDLCGRTMTFAYDTESQTYRLTIGIVRAAAGDVSLPAGDVVLNNSSVYTDANGNKTGLLYAEDWIVVSHTQTVVLAETLTQGARLRIVKGGYLVLRGMDGVNLDAVTVRVQTGGVYDLKLLDGVASVNTQPIVLAGGTLTNTGVSRGYTSNQHVGISLDANSTIDIPAGSDIVYYPPYAYNLKLNGHYLVKKGAGTFSIWQAWITNSGVFDIQEGRINFWICRAANQRFWVNVAEGAVANINEMYNEQYHGIMSDHIERLTGAGTVIFENGFPYNHGNFVGSYDWSGTIWIQNYSWNGWNLGNFAKANKGSKVKLTGFSGYAAGSGCDFEVILQDNGNTKAVTVSDVGDSSVYYFNKLSGSGTFTWNTSKTDATGGRNYWFKDTSDFTGKLVTGDFLQYTLGGTSTGELKPGEITIQGGAAITATNWSANSLSASGLITVVGERGSVIATVKNPPTLNSGVKLRNADGTITKGYYLRSRAVADGYEVYVDKMGFQVILR